MRRFAKWLIAGSAPLAALPLLDRPVLVAGAEVDTAWELVSAFPVSPTGIKARPQAGEIDKRAVSVGKEGLLQVGLGDVLEVNLKTPARLVGKRGSFTLQYQIREERKGGFCQKEVIHHPRSRPCEFESSLQVGKQIHVELILESLADSGVKVSCPLKPGRNTPIPVQAGARVLVRYHMQPEDVVFERRQTLTAAEHSKYVEPELAALRGIPNVELPEPVLTDVDVQPGNVGELVVEVKARRGRR